MGELERHDAGLPARCRSLVDARAERRGVDEAAVGDVCRGSGLADDELVDVNAVLLDLEDGGSTSAVEERVAVLVARAGRLCRQERSDASAARCAEILTVVELDVVPVYHRTNLAVDGEVSSTGVALLEPGCDGCVCDDVLAGGELSAKLLRECDEPVDGLGGAAVEGAEA